jgi:hypothetical protein
MIAARIRWTSIIQRLDNPLLPEVKREPFVIVPPNDLPEVSPLFNGKKKTQTKWLMD